MTAIPATGSTVARAQAMLRLAAGQAKTPYGATLAQPYVTAVAQLTGDEGLQRAIARTASQSSMANALTRFTDGSALTTDIAAALTHSDFPGSAQYHRWLADADRGLIVGGQTVIPALQPQDHGMLRTADLLLAAGEIAGSVNPAYFADLHTEIVDRGLDDQGMPDRLTKRKRVGPAARTAFADVLRRLEDDNNIFHDDTWATLREELVLYWLMGMGYATRAQEDSFSTPLQFAVQLQRALQRAAFGGASETQLAELLMAIDTLFFTDEARPNITTTYGQMRSVWEHVHAQTDPLEIFRPIDQAIFDAESPFRTLPQRYLRAAFGTHYADFPRMLALMTALETARTQAIKQQALGWFRDILADPELGISERTTRLHASPVTPEQQRLPFNAPTRQVARGREVVWNPFAISDPTVIIHPGMGQGNTHSDDAGEPIRKDGMVFVSFRGKKPGFTYEPLLIFATKDPEDFARRADERAAKYPGYPAASAALLMRQLMPEFADLYLSDEISRRMFAMCIIKDMVNSKPYHLLDSYSLSPMLADYSRLLGMDAIALALRLYIGEVPTTILNSEATRLDNMLTPDLFPAFLRARAWQRDWQRDDRPRVPNAAWAGIYYTQTFRGTKDQDLMPLYFAYRDGDPTATQRVVDLLRPLAATWMTDNTVEGEQAPVVVPIPGIAPNGTVAAALGYPTVTPWYPRPADYGNGVEGKTAMNKWRIVEGALQLDPAYAAQIAGRAVLFIDDNITDGTTYMVARKRVLAAGASKAGIVVLTRSVRSPSELDFILP